MKPHHPGLSLALQRSLGLRRSLVLAASALVLLPLSITAAVPASAGTLRADARAATPVIVRRPTDRSYSLKLPAAWKFRTARSGKSAHTDTWFDPKHPHDNVLTVLRSSCLTCLRNASGKPDATVLARAAVGRGVLHMQKLSAWEVRFSGAAGEGTFRVGRAIITRKGAKATGSVTLMFVVSSGQQPFANQALTSFRIIK